MKKIVLLLQMTFLFSACSPSKPPTSYEEFLASDGAQAESADCTTTACKNFRKEFRYTVYVGKKIYCYWDEKIKETGLDFDKEAKIIEETITDKTNLTSYFKTLQAWAGKFNDGHVDAQTGADLSELEIFSSDVRFELLAPGTPEETLVVATSSHPRFLPGDIIKEVNGQPIKSYLDETAKKTSGSTEHMRRFWAGQALSGVLGSNEASKIPKIKFSRESKDYETELEYQAEINFKPDPNVPSAPDLGTDYIKTKVLAGNVGYLRIDSFTGTKITELIANSMKALRNTSALLIDLRQNTGGNLSGNEVIKRIATADLVRYFIKPRLSDYTIAVRPDLALYEKIDGTEYPDFLPFSVTPIAAEYYGKKPVFALIGAACFSACDTFVTALKAHKLATIAGERSGGGTGSPLRVELPFTKLGFRYSLMRGYNPVDKSLMEGVATEPDIKIPVTVEERALQKDVQLTKAIAALKTAAGIAQAPGDVTLPADIGPIWEQPLDMSAFKVRMLKLDRNN